ncbi:MAG: iron-sulfur cluster insertion protein ErpA [Gammaproteobacteria bacterium]|nr:iron-sulfur cluster insertion protein ErpA [Gammaproteobacteria bacterium]
MSAEPLNFTDSAASRVRELIAQKDNPDLMLRVYVQGGGCSGFQYGFQFDESQNDDDMSIEKDGVTLLVDSISFQYLMGAEVDFKDDLQGTRFTVSNPNASTTCGCGSSFGI